jgi:nucleoside-diphosphate-sugar epimerase
LDPHLVYPSTAAAGWVTVRHSYLIVTRASAVQYTRYDDLTDDERLAVEQLGRKGNVIIKERVRNVVGADELSPKKVVEAVQARIPYRFTTDDFQRAWKKLSVRPATKSPHPERTDERYCTYHKRHGDYGYKPAFIEKLVRECSTAEGFTNLTGKPARDKATAQPVAVATTG